MKTFRIIFAIVIVAFAILYFIVPTHSASGDVGVSVLEDGKFVYCTFSDIDSTETIYSVEFNAMKFDLMDTLTTDKASTYSSAWFDGTSTPDSVTATLQGRNHPNSAWTDVQTIGTNGANIYQTGLTQADNKNYYQYRFKVVGTDIADGKGRLCLIRKNK